MGRDKRANIAALRQAKIYSPRQAAAAAMWIAAAAMHEGEYSACALQRLMNCGGDAIGIEVPQYKPFYTVPQSLC